MTKIAKAPPGSILPPRQHAENAARKAVQDEAIRRDTTWAKSYRKPEHCNEAPSSEMLVQCANEYIRVRPAFESAHNAQGKL